MLSSLHIENIAIIDRLDLEFHQGFNVLTGETGAGKSIIIDSILLLLGNKASKDMIRTGCEAGIVSASFSDLSDEAIEILENNGLSNDEEGNISIFRKIGADGRNNARINGVNVTVTILKTLGEHLINIHGQHDGVLLLDQKRHLSYLDTFGRLDAEMNAFETAYANVKAIQAELKSLRDAEITKVQRKSVLEAELADLNECNLQAGEYGALLAKRSCMMNNGEIVESLHTANVALYEGDTAAAQLVHTAYEAMNEISKLLPDAPEYLKRIKQISAEIEDLGAEFGKLFDDYAREQEDPAIIEARLDQLEKIKKNYGPEDQDVLAYHKKIRSEYEQLESNEEFIRAAEQRFAEARKILEKCAHALSEARIKAAAKMEKLLKEELCYLDMPKIRFKVMISDRKNERGGIRYRTDGKDDVAFYLSANAGEELRPLNKIASGGELSRIMLSMRSVLNQDFDTIIYDEIDTGVSGGTADKIGRMLQSSAAGRQVFCITHLAQIAARASKHYKVQKKESNGRVFSEVALLSEQERIYEIARIMGGEIMTDKLISSAEELLLNSKNNH